MKRLLQTDIPFVILLFFLGYFYISGVPSIPFHPDESTQLFMSSDFETYFSNPSSMFWQGDHINDPRQRYRELDAPLTKYLLGFGRWIMGHEALSVDWDWSRSWDENLGIGAYPDDQLSRIGRMTITLLLPISTILIYSLGVQIQGRATGFLAAFLFGTNPVVLLHGRRAMAEGALLLGTVLAIWCILSARRFPWLAGFGLAIAFNAKQSTLVLLPIGMLALIWLPGEHPPRISKIIKNIIQLLGVFTLITLALNPLFWQNPVDAVQSAVNARARLMESQTSGTQEIAPEKAVDKLPKRVFVLLLNLYISPPEYGLIENLSPTQDDILNYIAMPGHNLFRGLLWGSILLVLTIFGIYIAIRYIISNKNQQSSHLFILLLAMLFQAVGLIAAVQLYWIRYTIPLIPFISLLIAYGLTSFKEISREGKKSATSSAKR